MNRSKTILRSIAALVVAVFALGLGGQALAAEQQKITNPKVGKPLQAAQEAFKKSQWDQALAKLNEADAVGNKTPYEQFAINEFKGAVLLQQKKYAEAAPLMEKNLSSGFVAENDVVNRLDTLIRLYTQTKNYPKVTEIGDKWFKAGGTNIDTQTFVGQAWYLQKNYKKAIEVMQGTIKASVKAGKTPEENWMNIIRSSYQNLGDMEGVAATTEDLVRYYPKPEYWDYLLASRMRQKNKDRVQLNLFRLASQVGVMNSADEYIEMTEMLLEAGLPGEAKSVMEAGFAAKAFDSPDKVKADRYAKRLTEAKAAAAKDLQSLPTIEKDAQKAPTGQGDVALGMAYSSFGQYDKAVAALARGLEKGGVRDPQQAQIMLGIANVKLGKKADAIKAFESVKEDEPMQDVARLWTIVARSGSA